MMRNLTHVYAVWLVLASANVMAQDQTPNEPSVIELEEPEVSNELVLDEEPVTENGSIESQQEDDAQASQRFIPTEEISQDLGVSFPANI
jgi:hypothetical protein